MAETAAQKAKREAAEAEERDKQAQAADQDRASREAAAPDVAETRTTLVGAIATDQPQEPLEGVMADAAGALLARSAQSQGGFEHPPAGPTAEEIEAEGKRVQEREAARRAPSEPLAALAEALAEHEVGDPVTVGDLNPPAPGETERGWSPEVTARHPVVQAHYMEKILAEQGGGAGPRGAARKPNGPVGVDPLDQEALVTAQRELGFHDVRITMLKNEATRRASDDLAAAEEAANRASPAFALAMDDALDEIKGVARAAGHRIN